MSAIAGSISLITGGGSGLGRLVAHKLAARGSTVVLWDLSQAALDAVVAQVRAAGGQAHGYILPRLVFLVPAMRILPVAWFDAITDFLGVNVSMEEFVGRGQPAPERDA